MSVKITGNKVFCVIKLFKMQMNQKNLMVFLVMALFLVTTVSAQMYDVTGDLADDESVDVKVDGTYVWEDRVSVTAGESISIKVRFTSDVYDSDVTMEVELEGEKVDVEASTNPFDVEEGDRYSKTVTVKVPYELKDELSDILELTIELDGKDHKTVIENIELKVQRPSYNADIKSVSMPQNIEAGDSFPVDIVLKNIGYNDLDDLYVSVAIPALGVERTAYFGDIVALECDDNDDDKFPWSTDSLDRNCDEDDEDTVMGRLNLKIPYDVEAGVYTLEVRVTNDDTTSTEVKQIIVENDFTDNVILSSSKKSASVGQEAEYSLLIVNPTDKLKVFRIVSESSGDLSSSTKEAVVAVPAGQSKTITIVAKANSEGEYNFDVNVFSGETLVETVTLTLSAEGKTKVTDPIVVLTIILAIIFLVLLVVLIVLVTRKPEKSEEFGESYY